MSLAALDMDAICVTLGGLGSSFDQLALNRDMLQKNGVRLRVRQYLVCVSLVVQHQT